MTRSINETVAVIETADGPMETYVCQPAGSTPRVGVFVYMDVFGLRDEIFGLARAFADQGMMAIAPDLFHRLPKSRFMPADQKHEKVDPAAFAGNMGTTLEMSGRDTDAVIRWLDNEGAGPVPGRYFAIGYCMGGKHAVGVVSAMPERFIGGISVHGGQLVTDTQGSPHSLVAGLQHPFHFACAEDDPICPVAHIEQLREEASKANSDVSVKVYPAHHGWSFPARWSHDAKVAAEIQALACTMINRAAS